MKKSLGGSECPDLEIQSASTAHADRYKGTSQNSKNAENIQNKENEQAKKS